MRRSNVDFYEIFKKEENHVILKNCFTLQNITTVSSNGIYLRDELLQ